MGPVSIHDVTRKYDTMQAMFDVSFDVADGALVQMAVWPVALSAQARIWAR
jgi:hypothetical protein